jgi:hypothetical protein
MKPYQGLSWTHVEFIITYIGPYPCLKPEYSQQAKTHSLCLRSDKPKAGVSEQCSRQPYFNDKIL